MSPLVLILCMSLAAYRITRLVVADDFPPVQKIRDKILLKVPGTRAEWFGELITCYWCASFWVAGLVVGVSDLSTSVPLPILVWWAVAGAAAFLSFVEETLFGWAHVNMRQAQAYEHDGGLLD